MKRKITVIYFSPTGNTRKVLKVMADELGGKEETLDITTGGPDVIRQFGSDDFVLIGAPVHMGRLPLAARERLAVIRGRATPCLIAVTYGNREYDDALLELWDLCKAQGFLVKGAAALIGRHTYGRIQTRRPDPGDLAEARRFAVRAAAKPNDCPDVYKRQSWRCPPEFSKSSSR